MEKRLSVTILMENGPGRDPGLRCEHGLSLHLAYGGRTLLFDTGPGDGFLGNAERLGIDLSGVEALVLSHGHYDHTGGVLPFLDRFGGRPVWCGEGFFEPKYGKKGDPPSYDVLGNGFSRNDLESRGAEIREVRGQGAEICPGVHAVRGFDRSFEGDVVSPRYVLRSGGSYLQDRFEDETALVFETGGGLVMIVGCSHPGIGNMVSTVRERFGEAPAALIGGTHLLHADEARLKRIAGLFGELGIGFLGLNHCTGKAFGTAEHFRCGDSRVFPVGTRAE